MPSPAHADGVLLQTWATENSPHGDQEQQAFWNNITQAQRLATTLYADADQVRVVGRYHHESAPDGRPQVLILPVYSVLIPDEVEVRFVGFQDWVMSVVSLTGLPIPRVFSMELRRGNPQDMPPDWVFGPLGAHPTRFTAWLPNFDGVKLFCTELALALRLGPDS